MLQQSGHSDKKSTKFNSQIGILISKTLLVKTFPQNVMGRDILHQLGLHLTASKPTGKTIGLKSDITIEQNIVKWIFRKNPHLCTRLGRSENLMTKSTFLHS